MAHNLQSIHILGMRLYNSMFLLYVLQISMNVQAGMVDVIIFVTIQLAPLSVTAVMDIF